MGEENFMYPKLRGRIIEKYRTYTQFADVVGVARSVISRKLSGDLQLTKKDIIEWSKLLDISVHEVGVYFFDEELNEVKQVATA